MLHRGVKLKALHAVLFNQLACFSRAHFSFMRVNAGKAHHHVGVGFGGFGNFFVRNAPPAHFGFGIHGEHNQANFFLAVVRNGFSNGGTFAVFKILVGGFVVLRAISVKRVLARHFGVSVDVDGDEVFGVHRCVR